MGILQRGAMLAVVVGVVMGYTLPKPDPCGAHECRAGRECLMVGGQPECLCLADCPDHYRPVCGDDGRSYDNHCRLHQRACVTGNHIRVAHRGYCQADIDLAMMDFGVTSGSTPTPTSPTTIPSSTPSTTTEVPKSTEDLAVCFGHQRDTLREAAIRAWQGVAGRLTYESELPSHFTACDTDSDDRLRPMEMLDCFPSEALAEEFLVTRTLCVDALIEDVDTNKDWRLDLTEFTRLMDLDYRPIQRNCSLEGKEYTDGAKMKAGCNHCVCATGDWVCATRTCEEDKEVGTAEDDKEVKTAEEDKFGYMDSLYDLGDDATKDDDQYFDYETDNMIEDGKAESLKEQSKKEYNWLSPVEKKRLNTLEAKIKKFYKKFNGTADVTETKLTEIGISLMDSTSDADIPVEKEESRSEEQEDDLLDDYDDLLDKSELISDQLHTLRNTIRDIEERRALHKRHRQAQEASRNDVHINDIPEDVKKPTKKTEGLSPRKTALLAKLARDRQRALLSNDIWEDQWKAKIKKHRHTLFPSNHL